METDVFLMRYSFEKMGRMAREEVSIAELRAIADELTVIMKRVAEGVEIAEKAGLPIGLIHGAATTNTYIPFIRDWSIKLRADLEIQAEAHKRGLKSRAKVDQEQYRARRDKAKSKKK